MNEIKRNVITALRNEGERLNGIAAKYEQMARRYRAAAAEVEKAEYALAMFNGSDE